MFVANTPKPTAKAEATPKKPRHRKVTLEQAWALSEERSTLLLSFASLIMEFGELTELIEEMPDANTKETKRLLRENARERKRLRTRLTRIAVLRARFNEQAKA